MQKAFHFLEGPVDVLRVSTACRRWRELACAGSVWRVKAEREGILDKAAAFEVEVPPVPEGGVLEDGGTATMAFYARVFVLKVRDNLHSGVRARLVSVSPPLSPTAVAAATTAAQGYKMMDEDMDGDMDENEALGISDPDRGIRTAVDAWLADPVAAKAKYGPIASWDVSDVVNMDGVFDGAESFNGDLSRWNVGQVENMAGMFRGAKSFNGDLSRWDVGQVESMNSMFAGATSFNGDLSGWDVRQVEFMHGMFDGATSFNGDLSRWEVGHVVDMNYMFCDATSFNRQLDGAWLSAAASKVWWLFGSPAANSQ